MSNYIGKDFIHYGCGLEINSEVVLSSIPRSSKKNIKKAETSDIIVTNVIGTAEELEDLRGIWYYYDDPNFPQYDKNNLVYMAYLNEELIGGAILVPVGNHLFLNNLMASAVGKKYQLQGYLLWYIVNNLITSRFKYIDVGVSYRFNLYSFFKKWATFHYPVIFNPPKIGPHIKFTPFKSIENLTNAKVNNDIINSFFKNRPFTIVPDINYANTIAEKESIIINRTIDEFTSPIKHDLEPIEIIDLTELLPLQFGAVVVGMEVSPERLWEKYACYDHYKTEYIKKYISKDSKLYEGIKEQRRHVYELFNNYFSQEDVTIIHTSKFITGFEFSCKDIKLLSKRYTRFKVAHKLTSSTLIFPCHQNISEVDVEYIYAIYRGYLNLCSEWESTGVKGVLKI